MGLYGERVGTLSVLSKDASNVKRVESQLKQARFVPPRARDVLKALVSRTHLSSGVRRWDAAGVQRPL